MDRLYTAARCLAIYEHEISDTINVWEAGVDRVIRKEKCKLLL
jgi:hypothetical protein